MFNCLENKGVFKKIQLSHDLFRTLFLGHFLFIGLYFPFQFILISFLNIELFYFCQLSFSSLGHLSIYWLAWLIDWLIDLVRLIDWFVRLIDWLIDLFILRVFSINDFFLYFF